MKRLSNFLFILFIPLLMSCTPISDSTSKDDVYWLLTLEIKSDQLKNLKLLMAEMVKATQENENGALSYEWSVSDDNKTCYIFERYTDSAAVMIHLKSFGENFAERFNKVLEIKTFVYFGKPNDEVNKALSGAGAIFNKSIGGFTK